MKNWRVWDYERKPLGDVCAETMGAARKLAREVWPDRLAGDRLFDISARGNDATDELMDIIRSAAPRGEK